MRPSLLMTVLIATPLFAQPTTQQAPATQPVGLASLRNEARRTIEQRLADVPRVQDRTLEQVIHVGMEDGRLVVSSDMPDTDGPARIGITPLGGINVISVRRGKPGAAMTSDALRSIQLQHYDLSQPRVYLVEASIAALPGLVNIAVSWQGLDQTQMVQFIQRTPVLLEGAENEPPQVTVYVQRFAGIQQEREVARLNLVAPDLPTLVREHPREVRAYLKPALDELGLGELVATDPRMAWQVFAQAYVSDPNLAQQIRDMLPALQDPDFRVREQATEALVKLGAPGALELMVLDRSGLSPEQRSRIDQVIASYRTLNNAEIAAKKQDKDFLIDCLSLDDVRLRTAALEQLKELLRQPVAFDVNAPADVRATQIATLRERLLPAPATRNVP